MNGQEPVLFVDDDDVDVMNVRRAFNTLHISRPLYVAENGLHALQILRGQGKEASVERPRIVVTDINMPRMNGIEFIRELRSEPGMKDTCVFVLTTSNDVRDRKAAYELNVAGYILKPVDQDDFLKLIEVLDSYWSLIEFP